MLTINHDLQNNELSRDIYEHLRASEGKLHQRTKAVMSIMYNNQSVMDPVYQSVMDPVYFFRISGIDRRYLVDFLVYSATKGMQDGYGRPLKFDVLSLHLAVDLLDQAISSNDVDLIFPSDDAYHYFPDTSRSRYRREKAFLSRQPPHFFLQLMLLASGCTMIAGKFEDREGRCPRTSWMLKLVEVYERMFPVAESKNSSTGSVFHIDEKSVAQQLLAIEAKLLLFFDFRISRITSAMFVPFFLPFALEWNEYRPCPVTSHGSTFSRSEMQKKAIAEAMNAGYSTDLLPSCRELHGQRPPAILTPPPDPGDSEEHDVRNALAAVIDMLLQFSLYSVELKLYLPSQLAASTINLARYLLCFRVRWTNTLTSVTGYSEYDLYNCTCELVKIVRFELMKPSNSCEMAIFAPHAVTLLSQPFPQPLPTPATSPCPPASASRNLPATPSPHSPFPGSSTPLSHNYPIAATPLSMSRRRKQQAHEQLQVKKACLSDLRSDRINESIDSVVSNCTSFAPPRQSQPSRYGDSAFSRTPAYYGGIPYGYSLQPHTLLIQQPYSTAGYPQQTQPSTSMPLPGIYAAPQFFHVPPQQQPPYPLTRCVHQPTGQTSVYSME